MHMIKQVIKLIANLSRQEYARYLLLRAVDMYENSLEVMAAVPDSTLAYQGAKLHSALADIYVEVAKAINPQT
jgi:hypothetical protein